MKLLPLSAALAAFALAGCGPADRETKTLTPAPTSSYTKLEALADADRWVAHDPSRRERFGVQATGSMLPYFGSNAYLLVERNDGLAFQAGDVVTLRATLLTHRVRLVEGEALVMSGENVPNTASDGWVKFEAVGYRVAGILYFQRP